MRRLAFCCYYTNQSCCFCLTSQEDSDLEVSFKPRAATPHSSVRTKSCSSTATVPDTQSDDDTDSKMGDRSPSRVKFLENTVENAGVSPSGARGASPSVSLPSSPDERRRKLKELKQRTEKMMEGVRSSPPARQSRRENGIESMEIYTKSGVNISTLQDQ